MRNSSEAGTAWALPPIIRSRRRSIALVVTHEAKLVVRAPLRAPAGSILDFIREKREWIDRKIAIASARPKLHRKEFKPGESFLYLGEPHLLSIIDDAPEPLCFDGEFRLHRHCLSDARDLFIAWYTKRTSDLVRERLDRYSAISGIKYGSFRVTGARNRWGSCSAKNKLNFSWRLAMAPGHALDYVVVHELAHLEHKDHSRRFWETVAGILPLYRAGRYWIRDYGYLCDVL